MNSLLCILLFFYLNKNLKIFFFIPSFKMSQQLITEITRIAALVTKLKEEKNDAQVKYDEIIKKFNNFTTNVQDAIGEVLKSMNIDQTSKDNIIKKIKDKANDIIGKMLAENDDNNPNTQPEYTYLTGISEWQWIEYFLLLISFLLNFIFIFLFIYLNYNDMTLQCIII